MAKYFRVSNKLSSKKNSPYTPTKAANDTWKAKAVMAEIPPGKLEKLRPTINHCGGGKQIIRLGNGWVGGETTYADEQQA